MIRSINDCTKLRNGVLMPWFGLGVWQSLGDDATRAVKWAVEAGYRAIDTAYAYHNEKEVGEGIRQCGVDRRDLFITTKLWNEEHAGGYDACLKAFDTSLSLLGVDYVDLYLIHWPLPKLGKYIEAWKALEEIYRSGRARAIGVCNFDICWLQEIIDQCEIVPMVNQVEHHPYYQQAKLHEFCMKQGIQLEAYSPLAQGKIFSDESLKKMAEKYGKSVAQLVLRFEMQNGVVVIPKSIHQDRIVSNAQLFDFEISDEDMEILRNMDQDDKCICPDPYEFHLIKAD